MAVSVQQLSRPDELPMGWPLSLMAPQVLAGL